MPEKQYRCVAVNFRAEKQEDGDMAATGRAILYNEEVVLWKAAGLEEREIILPGAAAESIKNDDWRAVWNHRNDVVLGRMSSGTLDASEEKEGVDVTIHFPDSEEGRSKFESVRRGDVNQMSFAFWPEEYKEEREVVDDLTIYRTIISKMRVAEVSPVTFPAYENTSISARKEMRKQQLESEASEEKQVAAATAERSAELRNMELNTLQGGT